MSEDSERKEVVELIRACLLSSKGGVCLEQINRDYRDLVGEPIPYRKLGHANLADFFSKARDVCRLMESKGRLIVHPVATEATQHIDALVSQQKKSSSGRGRARRAGGGGGSLQGAYGFNPHPAGRRPNQRSNWVPPPNQSNNSGNSCSNNSKNNYHNGKGGRRPSANSRKVGSGRLPPRSSIASSTYRSYPTNTNNNPGGSHPKLRTPSSKPTPLVSPSLQTGGELLSHTSDVNPIPSSIGGGQPLKMGTFHHAGKQQQQHPRSKAPGASPNGGSKPTSERCYVKELTQYFKEKDMGTPEFKTSEMGSKKVRHRTYVSSVSVEGRSFRTFPVEYHAKELAEEAAARLAVEFLGLKEDTPVKTDEESTLTKVGEINSLITDRIVEIVGDKWNGIWSTQVDVEYKKKYKEVLPPDWPTHIIPSKHHLEISVPIENHYIVLPMKNEEESNGGETAQNNRILASPIIKEISKEVIESMSAEQNTLPPVSLPDESFWDVYITTVSSPADVVLRLLNDNTYNDLTTDMELYYFDYSDKLPPITEPVVGCLYAAKLDSYWHRVRVTNVHGIKVTCYFIDHGDEDVLTVQDLRAINSKFLQIPPQAISVKLAGLEHLSDDEMAISLVRESVLGKSLVAEVLSKEKGQEPRIIVFDTSTEDDIDLNRKVLEQVNEVTGSHCGALFSPGEEVSPAFLLSVSSSGDCIVQRGSFSSLETLIEEAKEDIMGGDDGHSFTLETNKLYLARNVINNQLFRASLLTSQVKEGKVEVIFVDHGNQEKVDLSDLREIGSGSKLLAEMPHQAFKCRLGNMPENYTWTREAANKLRSLIPEDSEISVKILSISGELPLVEMYLKERGNDVAEKDGDETDSSINAIISQMNDLFILNDVEEDDEDGEEESSLRAGDPCGLETTSLSPQDKLLFSEIASLKGLVPPKIPEKDEYFDVTVTLAASPSNFFVQPWRQTESLELLTKEINEYYSCPSRRVCPVTMEDLKKDSFFAAIHSDGYWYRIKVDRVLENQNIAVKFVDYGDFTMVNLKNLQPLWPQFRNLPMQAIKAFLSDIVPVNGDWTPDDAVWFSNRSVEKQFVSVVKDISTEEDGSIKLGISLIDVSHPKEDILIDKLLVDDKRAVYLCI